MSIFVTCSSYASYLQKVSRKLIVDRGHKCDNLGANEGFTYYVLSHMRSFLFGCYISFCYFFTLEVVRGHDFWPHLEMCPE